MSQSRAPAHTHAPPTNVSAIAPGHTNSQSSFSIQSIMLNPRRLPMPARLSWRAHNHQLLLTLIVFKMFLVQFTIEKISRNDGPLVEPSCIPTTARLAIYLRHWEHQPRKLWTEPETIQSASTSISQFIYWGCFIFFYNF
jgi:hypothetical protein